MGVFGVQARFLAPIAESAAMGPHPERVTAAQETSASSGLCGRVPCP